MMRIARLSKLVVATGALLAGLAVASPVFAAKADIDLLKSYIGTWRGTGVTNAAGGDESIRCRMDIKPNGETKVVYNGRCALAGGNVSINGTMAFVVEANRYEAVMSSNTAFQGVAIGKRRGNNVSFNMRERNPDTGAEYSIDADMALKSGDIEVVFTLTEIASGKKIIATVPFKK